MLAPCRRALVLPLVLAGCYAGLDPDQGPVSQGMSSGTGDSASASASGSPTSASATDVTGEPTTDATVTASGPTGDPGTSGPDPTATTNPGSSDPGTTDPGGTTTTGPDETTGPVDTGPDTTSMGETSTTTGDPPPDPAAMVCQRWNDDRANMSEGTWSGDAGACDKGDTGAPGRENARRLVNLYRFLAGLPAVAEEPTWNGKAQACALMMQANGTLSHSPPMNWKCWSAEGAEAAGKSNISGTAGVVGIDLYMVDPGNPTTIGHRRWILSNSLGPIGLGSTSGYSCLWVIGGQGNAGKAWTAWPPGGIVPLEAIHVPQIPWANVDETGWTIQSDGIDVTKATIKVTEGGADRPMKVTPLQSGFGSTFAISMIPQGWTTQAGKTYTVQVDGVPQPFSYEVQVVQCE
jgi:hypothetical protein